MVFVFVLIGFVSASVEVHNYSFDKVYVPFDLIKGEINLSVVGEELGVKVTSDNDDEMSLEDFFEGNGVVYSCSLSDCSTNYNVLSSGKSKVFVVPPFGVVYGGFVLNGEDVRVTGISFNISSSFLESSNMPIAIDFFEGEKWEFREFSGEYSGENWGCYSPTMAEIGPPIRKSSYCEMISIGDTNALYIGADVDDGDVVDLKMSVYPELGGGVLGSCLFNPGVRRGCVVRAELGEIFSDGDYQVCVSKPDSLDGTNYKLFQESKGSICGFVYSLEPGTGSEDYAIFVKEAKYANSSYFSFGDFDLERLLVAADDLVERKYNRDCSEGCILPFAISGLFQNVLISNVVIDYFESGRDAYTEESSSLGVLPATVDFSGVLDLSVLGFKVLTGGIYRIFINGAEILEEEISVLPVPIISYVSPLNPPAGVPVEFRALVQFSPRDDSGEPDGNESLSYKWNFGDRSSSVSTDKPSVVHTYDKLGNYSMSVKVTAGWNLSFERSFDIRVVSPEVAINETLFDKRKNLDGVIGVIGGLPSWYGGALSKVVGVDFFDGELKRLDKARNGSAGAGALIEVAKELYALDVPAGLVYDSFSSPDLMTGFNDIDVGVVAAIGGGEASGDYKNPIFVWQNSYITASVLAKKFSVLKMSGEKDAVFNVYGINVGSSDFVESYFVINKNREDLFFKSDVGAQKVDDAAVITLGGEGSKSFEFYYEDGGGVSFFVSPKLSSIVIESDIDTSCNFNFVCEDGEDYESCRSDCKPVGRAVAYGILIFVGLLIFCVLLQVWYKRRYESYLFEDRRQLYNLLMYVTNARARGVGDSRIRAELRAKGWSSEGVEYVIKKSRGKRVGMPEIIPIGRIAAWMRNRKARRQVLAVSH